MEIYTLTLNPCFDQTKYTFNGVDHGTIMKEVKETIIAGGKGLNISKVLTRLGIKSKAVIVSGRDNSDLLMSMLPELDIIKIPCSGKIRTNLVITNGLQEVKINQQGISFTETEKFMIKTKIWNLLGPNQLWILSGSLPPGIDPTFYSELILMVKKSNSQVWYDYSSCTLPKFSSPQETPNIIRIELAKLSTLIRSLSEDYIELGNQIRRELIRDSDLQVIVTLDHDGCLLVNSEEEIHIPILKGIIAINTVGAGDSFLAGMAAGKSLGLNDTHSLELATCVAGLTVSKELGKYPTMSEVSNMLKVNFRNNFPIEHLE
jgi:1-phosphofructokinase